MKIRFFYLTLLVCVFSLTGVSAQTFSGDTWTSVRSKNFSLIGNASEKEIRQVATRLEQFRETFRLLFPNTKFTQTIETKVVVFRDDASYRPFKPKRADGTPDDAIAGYFLPGEDVNYITLTTGGSGFSLVPGGAENDAYETIFHEYVHYLLDTNFDRADVPPWFNEGLAEYYQTFRIDNDQQATLGAVQRGHLYLLQQNQLIPLKEFFETDNFTLHQRGNHSRSVFYAQAWALIHYLIQGGKGSNADAMNKFLSLVMSRVEPEKAFQQAFGSDYATLEKALKAYISQDKFTTTIVTFKNKLVFDTEMTSAALSEAEANAQLGDLLYHARDYAVAESYLQKAIRLDANNALGNTALGLVKMRQRKFEEAKQYLEKAIAGDRQNHLAHYNYALILSRESMDEFGYVEKYKPESTRRMREALQKAIEINPNFTESYRLLAFVNLVNNENLDEALALLKKVLERQPGNQQSSYIIAQILLRQEKYAEARAIAEKLYKSADEPDLRARAQKLLGSLKEYEERRASYEKQTKELEDRGIRAPLFVKRKDKTADEIAKLEEENSVNNLNRMISKPQAGEKQAVGYLQRVACAGGAIVYTVKSGAEIFTLTSKDFVSLEMLILIEDGKAMKFGCNAQVADMMAVLTYRPSAAAKARSRGQLRAINFVPKFFRLKSEEELKQARQVVIVDEAPEPDEQTRAEQERRRRESMIEGIREALRKPLDGERRAIGIIEKIECGSGAFYFHARIGGQSLKLRARSPQDVKIVSFTPDASGLQFGCNIEIPPLPAVITYRPLGQEPEIVTLEYVPKSFTLE